MSKLHFGFLLLFIAVILACFTNCNRQSIKNIPVNVVESFRFSALNAIDLSEDVSLIATKDDEIVAVYWIFDCADPDLNYKEFDIWGTAVFDSANRNQENLFLGSSIRIDQTGRQMLMIALIEMDENLIMEKFSNEVNRINQ